MIRRWADGPPQAGRSARAPYNGSVNYESVLAVLKDESEKRQRQTRKIRQFILGLIVLQALVIIGLLIRGRFEFTDLTSIVMPLILIGGISAGFSPRAKNALIAALPESDPRMIGFLCEALGSGDADLVALARERLEPLLLESQPSSATLTPDQQSALATSLITASENFQLAALTGLARIGNKEAILTLEQYAANKSPKVAALAQRLLPDLRMRLARGIIDAEIARGAVAAYSLQRSFGQPPGDTDSNLTTKA